MAAAELLSRPATNPNFPLNLDIHPSNLIAHASQNLNVNDFDANFGSEAQEIAIRQYGIAGRVWEAAYAMTFFVHPPADLQFDPPTMIDASRQVTMVELGSGSGLVASRIARLLRPGRDHFFATDLPEVCPLLESNLGTITSHLQPENSTEGVIIVRPLSWGNHEDAAALASAYFDDRSSQTNLGRLTHIICSDLVYFPGLLAPLLRSLLHLSAPPFSPYTNDSSHVSQPSIFISYKIRSLAKETVFWSAFGLWFAFSPVLVKDKSGKGEWQRFGANFDDATFLFVAHRRPESLKWKMPPLDDDLLGGVGAYGTDSRKGDATFEILLLMSLEQE